MRKKEKEGNLNIYFSEKLLSFPPKVNNDNNKQTKHLVECNCWVCKILDSVLASEADTLKYEAYNIVSETGDSIYSPQYEEFSTLEDKGQVYVSETAIEEIVNRIFDQKRLGISLNNIKNDK